MATDYETAVLHELETREGPELLDALVRLLAQARRDGAEASRCHAHGAWNDECSGCMEESRDELHGALSWALPLAYECLCESDWAYGAIDRDQYDDAKRALDCDPKLNRTALRKAAEEGARRMAVRMLDEGWELDRRQETWDESGVRTYRIVSDMGSLSEWCDTSEDAVEAIAVPAEIAEEVVNASLVSAEETARATEQLRRDIEGEIEG